VRWDNSKEWKYSRCTRIGLASDLNLIRLHCLLYETGQLSKPNIDTCFLPAEVGRKVL
jgi:hypothetical protein